MIYHFELCPECLANYSSLRPKVDASYVLNVMPLCSLVWPDEHPNGNIVSGPGHEICRASIIRLAGARTDLWRSGMIPAELQTLWDEARRVMPEWPGFLRLSLDAHQIDSLAGCAEELDDVMGAMRTEHNARPRVVSSNPRPLLAGKIIARDSLFRPSTKCRRGDSNPHTFRYRLLRPARLPISPLLQRTCIRRNTPGNVNLRERR